MLRNTITTATVGGVTTATTTAVTTTTPAAGATTTAAAPLPPPTPCCIQSIAVIAITHMETFDGVAMLLRALDQCVVPAEQRVHAYYFGGSSAENISAALVKIEITSPTNTSILGPLTADYPMLVRSLQVLTIKSNVWMENDGYDESAAIGAFAALATDLRELTFHWCGLRSVRGLKGRCEYLTKVNLWGCKPLRSVEGLQDHVNLEEVCAAHTAITSVEPLRSCPALTTVVFYACEALESIAALADHRCLQSVDVRHCIQLPAVTEHNFLATGVKVLQYQ